MQTIESLDQEAVAERPAPAKAQIQHLDLQVPDEPPVFAHADEVPRHHPRRAMRRDDGAVLELDAFVTPGKFIEARRRRSVRQGEDVYLPIWSDGSIGLPNALLRSSLWSPAAVSTRYFEDTPVPALDDDVGIRYSGPQLMQYDRRVFATLLASYSDRPLSRGGNDRYIQASFFELARDMGNAYTRNTHVALRASLVRQAQAFLRVCDFNGEMVVPQLLDVSLPEDYLDLPEEDLKSSDQFEFRVPEEVASLYGPTAWSEVPKPVLAMKALRGWLAGINASQTWPQELPFHALLRISGLNTRPNDFRTRVCAAMDELSGEHVPAEYKVAGYTVSKGEYGITVRLAKWGE